MPDSVQPPALCHTRHEALMFAGIIAQHLPAEMTAADMEAWRNSPEGLEAVLAGLKSPPKVQRQPLIQPGVYGPGGKFKPA